MTAYHSTDPRFYHPAGAEYTVSVYEVDTAIPLTTYVDKDRLAMNPWPVVLEDDGLGNGYATIYIDAEFATIDLRDIDDVSVDGYPLTWVKPAQQDQVDSIDDRLVLNEATDIAQTETIIVIQNDVEDLQDRMGTAEGDITGLDGRVGTTESDIAGLDGRVGTTEGDIAGLDGRIGSTEGDVTGLDGRLDAAEATISSHTTSIGNLGSASTALSGRVDALEAIDHAPPTGSSSSFYDPAAGILIQFGSGTTASNGYAVVTFPTAYTSTPFVVASSNPGSEYLTALNVFSVLTTQFEVATGYSDGDGGGLGSFGFQWIAIGRKT